MRNVAEEYGRREMLHKSKADGKRCRKVWQKESDTKTASVRNHGRRTWWMERTAYSVGNMMPLSQAGYHFMNQEYKQSEN